MYYILNESDEHAKYREYTSCCDGSAWNEDGKWTVYVGKPISRYSSEYTGCVQDCDLGFDF